MQNVHPARSEGSSATRAISASWLHEDPGGVNYRLVVPGLMCPVGWGKEVALRSDLEAVLPNGETFKWNAIHLDSLRLSHPAHLMLIEGVVPAWLFMGAQIIDITSPHLNVKGPFMLLQMTAPHLHTVPFTITDIVFGLPNIPEGATLGELVPSMLHSLLTKPEAW